jgi:hypothetical protein
MHSEMRYNALPLMDIDNLMWKKVKTQFEQDFRTTPTQLKKEGQLTNIAIIKAEAIHLIFGEKICNRNKQYQWKTTSPDQPNL